MQVLGGLEINVDGARRSGADLELQGHDVFGRAEPRLRLRLHQRLVDLKSDLTCEYVCRLLNHMDRRGYNRRAA